MSRLPQIQNVFCGTEFRGKVIDIPEIRQKHNGGYKMLLSSDNHK